jgi:VIT1/CCC1 family predicted Fe2+/Mn2+ transporter
MHGQHDRIEQFKQEIADLRIKDPSAPRDPVLARLAGVGLVIGIALPIVAYFLSHGTSNALQQRDALVLALAGVALTMASGAVYLKASLSNLLRFWLLRDLHEQRAQTDRLLAGREGAGGPGHELE